jgi:hypothetical protein
MKHHPAPIWSDQDSCLCWQSQLMDAYDSGDEHGIWAVLRTCPDEEGIYDTFAGIANRKTYQVDAQYHYSEMIWVPILLRGDQSSVLNDLKALPFELQKGMRDQMQSWMNLAEDSQELQELKLFNSVVSYDWICTWSLQMMASHFSASIPGALRQQPVFAPIEMNVPTDAPQLGFLVSTLIRQQGWPVLPDGSVEQASDLHLREFISATLNMANGMDPEIPVQVLRPGRTHEALTQGVCHWLMALHDNRTILNWDALKADEDHIVVSLLLAHHDEPVAFYLRLHQMGLKGVRQVLLALQGIVPHDRSLCQA